MARKLTNLVDKKTGEKLYPIGSWEENEHKLYNFYNKADTAYRTHPTDEGFERKRKAMELLEKFDNSPRYNGIVYVNYDDYKEMKNVIREYNFRNDISAIKEYGQNKSKKIDDDIQR